MYCVLKYGTMYYNVHIFNIMEKPENQGDQIHPVISECRTYKHWWPILLGQAYGFHSLL